MKITVWKALSLYEQLVRGVEIILKSVYVVSLNISHDTRSDLQNENHQYQEGILKFLLREKENAIGYHWKCLYKLLFYYEIASFSHEG